MNIHIEYIRIFSGINLKLSVIIIIIMKNVGFNFDSEQKTNKQENLFFPYLQYQFIRDLRD